MTPSLVCNRYRLRFQDVVNVTDNDYEDKTSSPSRWRGMSAPKRDVAAGGTPWKERRGRRGSRSRTTVVGDHDDSFPVTGIFTFRGIDSNK